MRPALATRVAASATALGAALLAAACGDDPASPDPTPATLVLTIAQHVTQQGDWLHAQVLYTRTGAAGSSANVGSDSVTLSNSPQQHRITVSVKECLEDNSPNQSPACAVRVALALRDGAGATLATDTLRQITVTPNQTTTVPDSVLLERRNGILRPTLTDPSGDTLPSQPAFTTRAHDVRSITVGAKRDSLIFMLRFAAPVAAARALTPNSVAGFLEIDADENIATGYASSTNLFGGSATLGVDFEIDLFEADSVSVTLASASGAESRVPAAFGDSTIMIRVPFAVIGQRPSIAFAGVIGTLDRETDLLPNAGSYTVRAAGTAAAVAAIVGTHNGLQPTLASHARSRPWRYWGRTDR